jgi:hypothetical protein
MSGDCFHAIEERFMVQSFGEENLKHRRKVKRLPRLFSSSMGVSIDRTRIGEGIGIMSHYLS